MAECEDERHHPRSGYRCFYNIEEAIERIVDVCIFSGVYPDQLFKQRDGPRIIFHRLRAPNVTGVSFAKACQEAYRWRLQSPYGGEQFKRPVTL